ncbi:hypothetical protein KLP40_00970 [Hymenobacter sp. NST-14]|uniref:hypothetical protein n=1 Tax=Hymenobacter piscis TaxID=2839984 RepID=UPI001C016C7F|nr:hypothetical protein [Hymenobacter piscis]MBT9391718.1 hypothetical protein [Hymenobacter piscis]
MLNQTASAPTISPGRGLAVLLAVCALLWTWWQVPGWYRLGSRDAAALGELVQCWQQPWLLALLLTVANLVVLYRATLPLALPAAPASLLDRSRYLADFVFWLCLVFHLASLVLLLLIGSGGLVPDPLWL